jgi:uncharacterized membrane protein
MKLFIKYKITKKIKIMLTAFLVVSIVLLYMIIKDFLNYNIPLYYIFFILIWFAISLVFRKDKTIKWDEKTEKVVKNTEITTVLIILFIISIRKFLLPSIFEELHLQHITTITLLITLWFFSGKLYFMWDKLKDIFCEVCEK